MCDTSICAAVEQDALVVRHAARASRIQSTASAQLAGLPQQHALVHQVGSLPSSRRGSGPALVAHARLVEDLLHLVQQQRLSWLLRIT
jgi:hypothetical protein